VNPVELLLRKDRLLDQLANDSSMRISKPRSEAPSPSQDYTLQSDPNTNTFATDKKKAFSFHVPPLMVSASPQHHI